MVQGGLLTTHLGSVHGYGWSPGGGVSFRQGARAASPGSLDLDTAAAEGRRGVREKGVFCQGVSKGGENKEEGGGGREDPQGSQEAPWRGPGWGRARPP